MSSILRCFAAVCLTFFLIGASSPQHGTSESTSDNDNPSKGPSTQISRNKDASNSAAATASIVNVAVTIDALANRHNIPSFVYGGAYPQNAAAITDSGLNVVRWGGNATSTYNWQLDTYNADNDWYFEDFAYSEIGDGDSVKFINDVKAAGSHPLMTMAMLPWAAQSAENGSNGHWSFSVAKYGAQCATDPYNSEAGDGLKTDCSTALTANPNDAYYPLLDQPGTNDPPNSVYRNQWAAALSAAFKNAPHFYDMDNEIDIWGSTHRDIHPNPSGYEELRDVYLNEAAKLKTWDPQAIRLGPVSCCWWFYWNGANGNDKGAHAGIDFLPWWLNEVYWSDKASGKRSVEVFDVHAYPDSPSTSGWTTAQIQGLATRIYRDYWDPTYVSESSSINQPWATSLQPNRTIPFRIPRMRALANMIYPGTPVSFTEWSAAFAGESDFSTALGDADAYGILGRERVYLASRWVAPVPGNPNYLALKLFTNYDGKHHGFGTMSVSDTNNGNPDLFSSYAALNSTGNTMTVLVLNKDPNNIDQTQFSFNGFTAQQFTSYRLASTNPTQIVTSGPAAWNPTMTFAPYSATLLVIFGTSQMPTAEWDLNPDTTQLAAGATVTLNPKLITGSSAVTLGTPQSDSGISVTVKQPTITSSLHGQIVVKAGSAPGFYHFSIPGEDGSGITQTQGGWILVGNPAATLTKTGDHQTGQPGAQLKLSVTLNPGQSGGSAGGATVFFTTSAGSLSARTATTNASGVASVTLTLPSSAATVHVPAEGQYALGHPEVTFIETAQ